MAGYPIFLTTSPLQDLLAFFASGVLLVEYVHLGLLRFTGRGLDERVARFVDLVVEAEYGRPARRR